LALRPAGRRGVLVRIAGRAGRNFTDVNVAEVVIDLTEPGPLAVGMQVDGASVAVDVTGAGDTVIATLATMLAAGVALEPAVRLANRAGGIKVTKLGTAVVTRKELFG
jgi:bifunctional ADP-heptose synthase (sugar kinase/adenylyltransferase)